MKKILFMLIMCLSFVACSKDNGEEVTPMVTLSFNQQIVSSNSMTRATTNEFLDIISEQTPDYVNVTLKNLDLNKTYTCKSNETITIPIGNYEISAKSSGATYTQLSSAGNDIMYHTPTLYCDLFSTTIKQSTSQVTLNVYYNCYAIFAFIDECKSCNEENYNSHSLIKKGKYYVGYFKKERTKITLTPYDNSTEFITTTYNFSTTYDVNNVFAEFGKYYVIHPQKVDKTSCSFNVNITDMDEGEI